MLWFRRLQTLQLVGQVAEFKFESKFEALPIIWQSLRRLFQKGIEGLEGKINGQAFGAALLLCLRESDWWAQTQGVSESAAVAAGRNRLTWGKHATTLAILTQFKSQQGFHALSISGRYESRFLLIWNENFGGIDKKLLLTKAATIAALNLSIIHWSLMT